MSELVEHYQLNALLDSNEKDQALKTRQVRSRIFEIRFPNLSRAQKDKRSTLAKLKPAQTISIQIPNHFESPNIHFSFAADSVDQFKKQMKLLEDLAGNPIFSEIFTDEN